MPQDFSLGNKNNRPHQEIEFYNRNRINYPNNRSKNVNNVMKNNMSCKSVRSPYMNSERDNMEEMLMDKRVKYVFSMHENFVHDKSCRAIYKFPYSELRFVENYPCHLPQCARCAMRAYLRNGVEDIENYNYYMELYEKMGVTDSLIRHMYIDCEMKTRLLGHRAVEIKYKEDTWRIVLLDNNKNVKLLHNNYKVYGDRRFFTKSFHVQSEYCKETNIQFALGVIENYSWDKHNKENASRRHNEFLGNRPGRAYSRTKEIYNNMTMWNDDNNNDEVSENEFLNADFESGDEQSKQQDNRTNNQYGYQDNRDNVNNDYRGSYRQDNNYRRSYYNGGYNNNYNSRPNRGYQRYQTRNNSYNQNNYGNNYQRRNTYNNYGNSYNSRYDNRDNRYNNYRQDDRRNGYRKNNYGMPDEERYNGRNNNYGVDKNYNNQSNQGYQTRRNNPYNNGGFSRPQIIDENKNPYTNTYSNSFNPYDNSRIEDVRESAKNMKFSLSINDFKLVSEEGFPPNGKRCIYIWVTKDGSFQWQIGEYDFYRKQFTISFPGGMDFTTDDSKVVAWQLLWNVSINAEENEDNKEDEQ